jgi:hypothetical protein
MKSLKITRDGLKIGLFFKIIFNNAFRLMQNATLSLHKLRSFNCKCD